ncbi:sulfotransferase family protein [Rubrobacter aplysinae]|uniref:sulfotransferase family protein n=1 Tax=Rubrobacter aplysinae TaxID=909625 RepID=UPI00064BA293|nr:sulfotransferase [Rubrobacter aplysinae]
MTGSPAQGTGGPGPVFLLSLPRSGSTLAQRILAAHPEIHSTPEPWLLLPQLYTLKYRGAYAEYDHVAAASAVEEFYGYLPGGREEYVAGLREMVLKLYEGVSPEGTRYFLDKTPRYHLIVDEILAAFPDAKFVFLWRNPLAVAASMIETWAGGRWNLYRHKVDLFDGLENLVAACEANSDRVCAVRYEDLVTAPEESWHKVFGYLDLPFDGSMLETFSSVELKGRKGDPSGTRGYGRVVREPLERWRESLGNPFRKAWCRRYLRWLGPERAAVMGYDLDVLLEELDSVKTSAQGTGSDLGRAGYGILYDLLEPAILRRKLGMLPQWRRVHAHK